MTGCVKYELNRAAGACQIKLYSLTPTGGSFVLCPAHNIQPDLPPENIAACAARA